MKLTRWMAAAAILALAGCGGGDGAPAGPAPTIAVTGTAATGAPMAGATVSLLCASGGAPVTATTGADGKYSMALPATCTAPYMVKAQLGAVTLYAFADGAGNINITPFTHLAAGIATNNDTAAEYEAVKNQLKTVGALWTVAISQDALAKVAAKLAQLGVSTTGIADILHGVFNAKPGDTLDNALEALKAAQGGLPLDTLIEQVAQAGGTPGKKPWLTLFASGKTSASFAGTGCMYVYAADRPPVQNTTATITFTLAGDSLETRLQVAGADRPGTITHLIGPGPSEFSLYVALGGNFVGAVGYAHAENHHFYIRPDLEGEDRFRYVDTHGYVLCESIPSPMTPSQLRAFNVPARMAAATAPRETPIGRESCELDGGGSFSYDISSSGDMSIDGVSFAAQPLAQGNAWSERSFWGPVAAAHTTEVMWGDRQTGKGISAYRTDESLYHDCGPYGVP